MMRKPAVLLDHDELWGFLRGNLTLLERGLVSQCEQFDFSNGSLAPAECLARDAAGAAVLVLATGARDPALIARVMAAHSFMQRNAAMLGRALPDCDVRFQTGHRLLVVGTEIGADPLEALRRAALPHLEVLEIEPFRVAGTDRLVVRTLLGNSTPTPRPDSALSAEARRIWEALAEVLVRLDPGLAFEGDRYSRRVICGSRLLCEFWTVDDRVFACLNGERAQLLHDMAMVHAFGDRVIRRFCQLQEAADGVEAAGAFVPPAAEAVDRGEARSSAIDDLRQSLSASRLTNEEFSALGELGAGGKIHSG